jgi:hypothetical protein
MKSIAVFVLFGVAWAAVVMPRAVTPVTRLPDVGREGTLRKYRPRLHPYLDQPESSIWEDDKIKSRLRSRRFVLTTGCLYGKMHKVRN